jgi:hypothetical protein
MDPANEPLSTRALYLLMQQRFSDMDKAVLAALTAQKDAVDKAEESATKRFDEFKREIGEKIDSLLTTRDTGAGGGLARREIVSWIITVLTLGALVYTATHHP